MTTSKLWRATVAALVGIVASRAAADFRCEKTACLVQGGEAGLPLLDPAGLPSCVAAPSGALSIDRYPALVAFRVDLTNLVADTSVVTGVFDPILASSPLTFGASFEPGFAVSVGGTATEVFVIPVASREACLALFGGPAILAPATCGNVVENRFVVEHDVGSAECRARITCGGAPTVLGRVPAPACPSTWHGVKLFGAANASNGGFAVALDPSCGVNVAGSTGGSLGRPVAGSSDAIVAPFAADGSPGAVAQFGGAGPDGATGIAVDAAGNRYVAWDETPTTGARAGHLMRLDAAGGPLWDVLLAGQDVARIAADVAGNVYAVGSASAGGIAVVKVDPTGAVLWTRVLASSAPAIDTKGTAIAIGGLGEVLVAGYVPGTYPGPARIGYLDTMVAKLSVDGDVVWIQRIGDGDRGFSDLAAGVGGDGAGNVFVALNQAIVRAGIVAPVVVRLDPAGHVVWRTTVGTDPAVPTPPQAGSDVSDLAATDAGDVWITGTTWVALPGQTLRGFSDAFVARLAPSGAPAWVTQFGTDVSVTYTGQGLAVDGLGNAFVTGADNPDRTLQVPLGHVAKLDPLGNVQ